MTLRFLRSSFKQFLTKQILHGLKKQAIFLLAKDFYMTMMQNVLLLTNSNELFRKCKEKEKNLCKN